VSFKISKTIKKHYSDLQDQVVVQDILGDDAMNSSVVQDLLFAGIKDEVLEACKSRHAKREKALKGDGRTTIELPGGVKISAPASE
jgi:hypothetical protein